MYNWTKEQTELLKGIKSEYDFDRIAVLVNKTRSAVKIKANRMKIYSYPEIEIYHTEIPIEIKAYLSGHFDGEGCISMSLKYSGNLRQRLTVAVAIANKPNLELYLKYFKGSIRDKKHFTNKPLFIWTLCKHEDLYNLIDAILPYSIEKKPQLEIAKEWLLKRAGERKTVALSNEFIEYSNDIAEQLKQLKKL